MKGKNTRPVCLVQLSLCWENQKKNYNRIFSLLEKNPPPEGSIICLPELFSTGYTMRPHLFSEHPGTSETQDFLASLAKRYHSHIIGSLIVRLPGQNRPFNSAIVLSPEGKTLRRYDKVHLFPLGRESRAYSPGKSISVFSIKGKLFSVFICYDLRFPELFRIAREKKVAGAFLIANWPAERQSHWENLIRARAVENQYFVMAVNRCGRDPVHSYKGGSCIIDPSGKTLISSRRQEILTLEIDLDAVSRERASLPFQRSSVFDVYKKYKPYK